MTIISISDYLDRKGRSGENMSIEQMLVRASAMVRNSRQTEELMCMNSAEFRRFFETRFNEVLMKEKLVTSENFLCSMYIARTVMDNIPDLGGTFYATDYMEKWLETGENDHLKRGADTCFVLCTFFPERCERRSMKRDDYVAMGSGLYYRYYSEEGKEVAYHMSSSFDVMSGVAARCLSE
ncbi:hypothetical protein ACFL16_02090 [Patescibacteria group bacterium]